MTQPSSGPLISADDLRTRLGEPLLRVCDTRWYLAEPRRGRAEYHAAHIPGARYLSLDDDLTASTGPGRHPLPDRSAAADRFASLGIGDEHTVVAYDSRGGAIAARLWWMLRWIGHTDVLVLDGGITAWEEAGFPLDHEVPRWEPAALTMSPAPGMPTIDRAELAAANRAIVDARDPERYLGIEEPIDPIAGHIPTAVNRPYARNLAADLRMLPADELLALHGDIESPVVYCGSGVTACHDILAREVAGLDGATLYPGSWSDWSTAGMPVATGGD